MFDQVNKELEAAVQRIAVLTSVLSDAETRHLTADAEYENAYALVVIGEKAKNPNLTQSDLKALATHEAHGKRMELVQAISNERRIKNELKMLRDKLDAYREMSYNLRQEAKI